MLLLGVTGCAMSTPASVGSVGGVDIPAGIYLLAQYNAYNTASGAAKLATGETASNVKAVLKAECTGTSYHRRRRLRCPPDPAQPAVLRSCGKEV